jgi:CheY-like chemotaxis protein
MLHASHAHNPPGAIERRYGVRPQPILVIDDCPDVRDLWNCWLSLLGFQVREAENGWDGVRYATAAPPALILMDICMPVMDGWRATEILKTSPQTAHVPIVAVSALGTAASCAARAAAVGCDAFVSKPCELADLLGHIRHLLRRSRHNPQVRAASSER